MLTSEDVVKHADRVAEVLNLRYQSLVSRAENWLNTYFEDDIPTDEGLAVEHLCRTTDQGWVIDSDSMEQLGDIDLMRQELQDLMGDCDLPLFDDNHYLAIVEETVSRLSASPLW